MKYSIALSCLLFLVAEVPVLLSYRDDGDDDGDDDAVQVAEQTVGDDASVPGPTVNMASLRHALEGSVQTQAQLQATAPEAEAAAPAVVAAAPAVAPAPEAAADAKNAHTAAQTAKKAASAANKVAKNSVKLADNARDALLKAHNAVHEARVGTEGLTKTQKSELKAAEAKLKEATKKADYGAIKNAKYVDAEAENKKLQEMKERMDTIKKKEKNEKKTTEVSTQEKKTVTTEKKTTSASAEELKTMSKDLKEIRAEMKRKGGSAEDDKAISELQEQVDSLGSSKRSEDAKSMDEIKAEIERLRSEVDSMPEPTPKPTPKQAPKESHKIDLKPLSDKDSQPAEEEEEQVATPVEQKGIDIDTAMPYGDLEPFGREDTAQELTESSIKESDGMVDQLERAEVSEEKRAVFRALTRLRGAAITSFDGVARSQTGNIDEYNKVHKWRNAHPLHHLADEESDISKWAFPDNADF